MSKDSKGAFNTYLVACCHGASQVMLQRSVLTGVLFLLGILAGGWTIFVLGIVSLLSATYLCDHKRPGYVDGLWGFNALLVGCAGAIFPCPDEFALIVAIYLTIFFKLMLDEVFQRIGMSSLTLPFILATWLFIGAAYWWDELEVNEAAATADAFLPAMPEVLCGLLKGLSQVFLVNSWLGGLLILAGLFVASWRVALWALVGSAMGMACAAVCGCEWSEIANGLWGFSPALTAIAIGVTFRPESATWRWILITIAALLLTFVIQLGITPLLALINLPPLTFPFCLATWLTLYATRFSR